jgi:photosynthetic reaction center cytochrome c subunit
MSESGLLDFQYSTGGGTPRVQTQPHASGQRKKFASKVTGTAFLVLAGAVGFVYAQSGHGQASPASAPGETAGTKYKNIQVLKDIPADQLIPSMQFITASLGVQCNFCHVDNSGKLEFDKDDKKEKKTARKMMQMTFAINQNSFDAKQAVTCTTCHRGSPHPQAIPAIAAADAKPEAAPHEEHHMNAADMPPADPVLARYIQALGGPAALANIKTRVEKGKALMPDGPATPIDIYTKAPDQRVSVMHTPRGESVTAYNGQGGWLSFPGRPLHEMSASDQLAAKLDAEAFYPNLLQQQFTELKSQENTEKVAGQDTDLVLGISKGLPPVKFYFDKSTGLLARMVHYTETPLGLNPTQVDFADYRAVDGVKTPYRWTIARPSGAFTIQIDEVQQNVPIDAARFEEPKPTAMPAPPPGQASPPAPSRAPGAAPQGPKPPQESLPPPGGAPAPGSMP